MALVVVAEDDSGTLKLIGVTLKNQGHEVLTAGDGISAWALIREHRAEVIVSDVPNADEQRSSSHSQLQ